MGILGVNLAPICCHLLNLAHQRSPSAEMDTQSQFAT
jgi:hypothetical protein